MQRLLLLGLNHTTAPLEVRERLAFGSGQGRAAVAAFRERHPAAEAVLLSTCNRVELYVGRHAHTPLGLEELVAFLAEFHDVPAAAFRDHLYQKAGRDAVEHLFTVASSLDSMVLGETQILGQVRDAYDAAREMQAAGALLNPLFQRAVAVGKQVMHETSLSEGRLSVASVAVDYAKRHLRALRRQDHPLRRRGEDGQPRPAELRRPLARPAAGLQSRHDESRSPGAANSRARRSRSTGSNDHLVAADIVVTSTGSAHPIITRKSFQPLLRLRRYRPIFLIDIAVPRDVESSVGDLDHVYLYNVDDLQQVVANTVAQRNGAIDAARAIVARHVDEFAAWHRQREMGPIIDRLSKRYHRVAKEELDRTVNKLSNVTPADRANLEDLVRRVVNKLLHNPIRTLRTSEGQHSGLTYLHAMEKLFDLEKAEEAEAAIPPEDPAAPDQGGQTSG